MEEKNMLKIFKNNIRKKYLEIWRANAKKSVGFKKIILSHLINTFKVKRPRKYQRKYKKVKNELSQQSSN